MKRPGKPCEGEVQKEGKGPLGGKGLGYSAKKCEGGTKKNEVGRNRLLRGDVFCSFFFHFGSVGGSIVCR